MISYHSWVLTDVITGTFSSIRSSRKKETFWVVIVIIVASVKSFRVVCPACDSEFLSYERFIDHVFLNHKDQPSLRMKAKIRKTEHDWGWTQPRNLKMIGPKSLDK